MTDTIIQEGLGYFIAVTDQVETGIPYRAQDRDDGNRNHGFFDLRDRPDLVDTIKETKKSQGMAEVLRAANEPGSSLMSLGCECHLFRRQAPMPDGTDRYVGSFIPITYREAEANKSVQEFVALAKSILDRVAFEAGHVITFEMLIEPLRQFFGEQGCYALAIRTFGHGRDDEEAWAAFNKGTLAVAEAIRKLPKGEE